LFKGKQHVAEEVPEGGHADGEDPEEVETPVGVPVGQQMSGEPEGAVVDAEADKAHQDELHVFHPHLLLAAAEGPDAVEDVIGGGGGDEAGGVGHKLVDMHHIAQQVEHPEVHHHATGTDHAELEKPYY